MKLLSSAVAGMLLSFSLVLTARSQSVSDSSINQQSVSRLHQIYFEGIGDNAAIYHGIEYISNGQKALGYPYYASDSMQPAGIYYQGMAYPQEKSFYNIVTDELIIYNYEHDALISLSPEKVDSFKINNKVFTHLRANTSAGIPKDGYYDRLSSGEPMLFVRREKRLDVGSGNNDIKYIQSNFYFIKMKNAFYPIDGKKSMMKLFGDHEDELKKYGRANNLNFKKDLEQALLMSAIYYSQLKN